MTTPADSPSPGTSRERLQRMLTDAAIADAAFRALLIADPPAALAAFFNGPPPTDVFDFRVVVEDARTYYFVVPAYGLLREVAVPPELAPRTRFEGRLNSILRKEPERFSEFEANPHRFVADRLTFRLSHAVEVIPLQESKDPLTGKDIVYIVLRHPSHEGLFTEPFALRFAKATSRVVVQPSESLDTPDALAVEAWFRASSFQPIDWQNAVVSRHSLATGFELRVGGATPCFMVTVGGVHHYARTPFVLLGTNRWYYLCGIYTGDELQLWVDGILVSSLPLSGPITQDTGPLAVGNNSDPTWVDRQFQGDIDEVRLWGRPLTKTEIRRSLSRKASANPEPVIETERLYLPCSEGNGTVVHDQSGYGNDGTLKDVEWVSPEAG